MRKGALAASDISELKLISRNPDDTLEIGRIVGEELAAGDVVALIGDLGTGKTCFTQGIARALDVSEEYCITSPTFTLINEYPGRINLYHMDMYRISDARETLDMGFEDYLTGEGICVVEWAEKIAHMLPEEAVFVHITYIDENERDLILAGCMEKMKRIAKALDKGGVLIWRS